ncbi:hypothetical protein ACFQU7_35390 [Pseudoroseomonas wenyumeiae]
MLDAAELFAKCRVDEVSGCMVTLASVDDETAELREFIRGLRALTLDRLEERVRLAIAGGEISPLVDTHALSRFAEAVLNGMSVEARSGATVADLRGVAEVAMLGWDASVSDGGDHRKRSNGSRSIR